MEGRHDAELVERVWGDDLRVEGVVVEYLEGVDDLDAIVKEFRPDRDRRIGVLVDHLVPNSKESRIADQVARGPYGAHVLVVGHPYIDIWQAVKPARVGLSAWPSIPRSVSWKHGICAALGLPHESQADIARAWKRILGQVRSYSDLEPELLGRVEQLIDFVTEPDPAENGSLAWLRAGPSVPCAAAAAPRLLRSRRDGNGGERRPGRAFETGRSSRRGGQFSSVSDGARRAGGSRSSA